ncbi:MAG: dihydroorotate dehydrogenase electron transfer subunit [Planctomycetota bacterium]
MTKRCSALKKGDFTAVVCSNEQIGRAIGRVSLKFSGDGAKAFADAKPGQFAELDLGGASLPAAEMIPEELVDSAKRGTLLRRPFSFTDIRAEGGETIVDILYNVVGPSTLRMGTLSTGDSLSVIGPLGNGFRLPEGKKRALLAAGGMGTPPIQHLAKVLASVFPKVKVTLFAGAKSREKLTIEFDKFSECNIEAVVSTDDGSAGLAGFVTVYLEKLLVEEKPIAEETIIYSCGPEEMLAKVAAISAEAKIDCQVSMERRMACGIGLCQSCAVECKTQTSETIYKLCCIDGPVFDAGEVVFSRQLML